ncbi:hypothetical protein DVR12_15675 [Chitinophaga silvatica]|uniref:Uncharacterized protein n=1 Tax=Chitinophaga silvatica TaxID=2282649 RepID=A0A3E1Y840_9BACT|nr:hypothetical protein [Chitinophaga silvatica]RFS21340.1 hypothetical protein DVR12_15675 [Chitinophaga silvatica]
MNTIFEKSNYTPLWQAIASNDLGRVTDKLRDTSYLPVQLAKEILSQSALFEDFTLSLKANGESQFTDLVRLLISLSENGNFAPQEATLRKIVLQQLSYLSAEVRTLADHYPERPITADVWLYAVVLREWCNVLIDFFSNTNLPRPKAAVWQNKSKITCSIMSHYPHFVGPDMMATAEILEEINETELAVQYALAVLGDFEGFIDATENSATLEDIISLSSLKDAYVLLARVQQTDKYNHLLKIVEERIERGVKLDDK